jgi:alcohol dehydrogenase class IV
MDALLHAVEAYLSKPANLFSDAFALQSIKMVSENLREAVCDGRNIEIMGNMALASMIGGVAATLSDCIAGRCMAESIGSVYDLTQGLACGNVLPLIMEYNLLSSMDRLSDIAEALWVYVEPGEDIESAAVKAIHEVKRLAVDVNLRDIRNLISGEPEIMALAQKAAENISVPSNPRPITHDDFRQLFLRLFQKQYT